MLIPNLGESHRFANARKLLMITACMFLMLAMTLLVAQKIIDHERTSVLEEQAKRVLNRAGDRSKAVYGNAAFTCLQRSGLITGLSSKLMEVATVPQVSAYLVTGDVDAGFINATEALALKDKVGDSLEVAPDCYDPIELSLAVLGGRDQSASTRAFIEFVATPQARQVMQRHGL